MNFINRVILVDEKDAIAVFLEESGKERCVDAGTERALEIVKVHDRDFGIFVAARGTSADVDLLHRLRVRIGGQIELAQADQGLVIVGEQKREILFSRGTGKRNRQRVIVRKLAWPQRPHNHIYVGGKGILRPHVALNGARDVGRSSSRGGRIRSGTRLGRTAQTDQQKD